MYSGYGHFLYLETMNIRIRKLVFYEFRNSQNRNVVSLKSSLNLGMHFQATGDFLHCIPP